MNLSLLAGATSGLSAAGLVALGLVILVPLSFRLLFVIRRPGRARIAKGFAAGALVLLICGIGLFLAADLTDDYPSFRHLLDSATPVLAGLALALAAAAGVRTGVRAGRRLGAAEASPAPGPARDAPDGPAPPGPC
jgi:drug/metabolite transporter (DMT)-like permease